MNDSPHILIYTQAHCTYWTQIESLLEMQCDFHNSFSSFALALVAFFFSFVSVALSLCSFVSATFITGSTHWFNSMIIPIFLTRVGIRFILSILPLYFCIVQHVRENISQLRKSIEDFWMHGHRPTAHIAHFTMQNHLLRERKIPAK